MNTDQKIIIIHSISRTDKSVLSDIVIELQSKGINIINVADIESIKGINFDNVFVDEIKTIRGYEERVYKEPKQKAQWKTEIRGKRK